MNVPLVKVIDVLVFFADLKKHAARPDCADRLNAKIDYRARGGGLGP